MRGFPLLAGAAVAGVQLDGGLAGLLLAVGVQAQAAAERMVPSGAMVQSWAAVWSQGSITAGVLFTGGLAPGWTHVPVPVW